MPLSLERGDVAAAQQLGLGELSSTGARAVLAATRQHTMGSWRYKQRMDQRSLHNIGKSSSCKNNKFSTSNSSQASLLPVGANIP